MSANDIKFKKYELVAPDGGWSYMIAIAMIINIVTTTAFLSCFGLLYNDFLNEIGMQSTSTTLLTGICALSYAISGFFTSSLLTFLSMRQLALLAAICFNIGVLGNVFVHSIFMFFVCQGILQGIGLGILYNISCTMLNEYFVKKRLMAISFVQTCIALLTMIIPMLVKWSLEEYGYRGTLLLVFGITLHNILGATLLQPVAWHMKKIVISNEKEIQVLISHENDKKTSSNTIPVVKLTDIEENVTKSKTDTVLPLPPVSEKIEGIKRFFKRFLDLVLFKQLVMSCILWGPALSIFVDSTYSLILPQALYSVGWDPEHVAFALSLYGFGDLSLRIIFVIGSKWLMKLGIQELYLIGIIIGLVSRIGMLCSKSTPVILVFVTIIGVSHCSITILLPLVVADAVTPEKFTAAMGFCMLLCGLSNLVLAPVIGAVRDLTNSYLTAFYILTSCLAVIILFWSIELCYKRNKHKREQRKEYVNRTRLMKLNKL